MSNTIETAVATADEFEAMFGKVEVPQPGHDEQYAQSLMVERKMNKSQTIRYLTAEGWKRGRIAKAMNIRYQHVRNVQMQILKKDEDK